MKTYILWLMLGAILLVCFGYLLQHPIPALAIYILVYKPVVDYYYIRKRKLYEGRNLWIKYPFWGYGRKLLWGTIAQ